MAKSIVVLLFFVVSSVHLHSFCTNGMETNGSSDSERHWRFHSREDDSPAQGSQEQPEPEVELEVEPSCGQTPDKFDRKCCLDAQYALEEEIDQLRVEGYQVWKESYLHWSPRKSRCIEYVLPFWENFKSRPNCRELTSAYDCCGRGVGCRWSRIYQNCRPAAYLVDMTEYGTRFTKREVCK